MQELWKKCTWLNRASSCGFPSAKCNCSFPQLVRGNNLEWNYSTGEQAWKQRNVTFLLFLYNLSCKEPGTFSVKSYWKSECLWASQYNLQGDDCNGRPFFGQIFEQQLHHQPAQMWHIQGVTDWINHFIQTSFLVKQDRWLNTASTERDVEKH